MSPSNLRSKLAEGLQKRQSSMMNDEGLSRIQASIIRSKIPSGSEKVYSVRVDEIKDNPFQYRTVESLDGTDLESLAQTIATHGLQEPLRLRRKEGELYLVAGWRRLTSIRRYLRNMEMVNAFIRDDMDDATHRALTIIENEQRVDFSLFERAHAYHGLNTMDGMTQEQIAKLVGSSKSRVSRAMKLLSLPEDIQRALSNAVQQGLSMGHADEICSGFEKRVSDPDAARKWASEVISLALAGNATIENLRDQNRASAVPDDGKISGRPQKKPVKRWQISGGDWNRFEVSTRNKVTLEFKLPQDLQYNDTNSIVRYIRNQLLKSPTGFSAETN